ncbi:single-stranded DNA-binding protein [bacterium]|nr:single-stranded DNA-binding protein [bacterium]
MANLNKVFLIGNLTRDPELKYIPSGTAVADFSIAINRFFKNKEGTKTEDTCFVRVVVWANQAEACAKYLSKGRPVFIEGRLQSRSWEDKDGQKRSAMEVVAERVQFLGGAQGNSSTASPSGGGEKDSPIPEIQIEDKGETTAQTNSSEKKPEKSIEDEVPF